MKYQKIKGIKHYVFDSMDEFEGYFKSRNLKVPAIVPEWLDAKQGDWTIADDGGIVQILKRKITKTGYPWIRTVVGTFRQDKYGEMDTDFSMHPSRYTFSGKMVDRDIAIKNRTRITRREREFVINLIRKLSIKEAYTRAFGESSKWDHRSRLLFKQERIMSELRNQSKEAANDLGLDIKYIMQSLMKLSERAEDRVRLGALKELKEILEAIDHQDEVSKEYAIDQSPLEAIDMGRIEKDKLEVFSE